MIRTHDPRITSADEGLAYAAALERGNDKAVEWARPLERRRKGEQARLLPRTKTGSTISAETAEANNSTVRNARTAVRNIGCTF